MKELQRIQVGEFKLEDAVTVAELKDNISNNDFLNEHFISVEKLFENKEKIELNNRKLELFLNGVKLDLDKTDGVYKTYNNSKFIGIGVVENKLLKRDIVI